MNMRLIEIPEHGMPAVERSQLTSILIELTHTAQEHYKTAGFTRPWVSYFGIVGNHCIGTCSFKGAPAGNKVEIFYFTFPEFEGKGCATLMGRELLEIAHHTRPNVVVTTHTLREENAFVSVLKKLGFVDPQNMRSPEDTGIWEWTLKTEPVHNS